MEKLLQYMLENLGEWLISLRRQKDLTQKQLAEKLGIREQQIQRYEATKYQSASLSRLIEVITAIVSTPD